MISRIGSRIVNTQRLPCGVIVSLDFEKAALTKSLPVNIERNSTKRVGAADNGRKTFRKRFSCCQQSVYEAVTSF